MTPTLPAVFLVQLKNCGDSFRGAREISQTYRVLSENSYRKLGHECCYTVYSEHPRPAGLPHGREKESLTLISILH
jgi:hypothetical protein